MSARAAARVDRGAGDDRDRAGDREADRARDLRTARLPRERRHRLPLAGALGALAVGRRGAADPARDPDRLQPGRRHVRPRRALDRPAPARQREADRHPRPPARPRQHGDRGRARRGDDDGGRPPRRPRPRRRRARRARDRRGDAGRGVARRRLADRPVPLRQAPDRGPGTAARAARGAAGARRPRTQPQGHRRRGPARRLLLRHRCLGLGQVDPGQRDPPPRGRQPPAPGEAAPRRPRRHRRAQSDRQDHQHRPVADRPHAALQPGHLHRRLRPHPPALHPDPGGEGARLQAGALQLQRQGRPLRGLQGRRPDQDRDALPARRLRPLRAVPRQALQPRDAGGAVQGQEHRRRARDVGRGGGRVLRERAEDRPPPPHPARRRARLHPPRPGRRRRSPAARRSG